MANITPRHHSPYERRAGNGAYGVTVFQYTRWVLGVLYGFDVIYDGAAKSVTVFTYRGNGQFAEPSHCLRGHADTIGDVRRMLRRY